MFIIYPPGQALPSSLPLWAMGIFVISEQQRLAGSLIDASSSFSATWEDKHQQGEMELELY